MYVDSIRRFLRLKAKGVIDGQRMSIFAEALSAARTDVDPVGTDFGYADRLTLSIRLLSDHPALSSPDEIWIVDIVEPTWPRDWPAEVLSRLTSAENYPLPEAYRYGMEGPPQTLGVRRNYVDWGASGASHEVVLEIGAWIRDHPAEAALIAVYVKRVLSKFADRARTVWRRRGEFAEPPLAREQALSIALRWVERHYGKQVLDEESPAHALVEPEVVEDQLDQEEHTWTFVLRSAGEEYEVELFNIDQGDAATLGRIRRRAR